MVNPASRTAQYRFLKMYSWKITFIPEESNFYYASLAQDENSDHSVRMELNSY